MSTASKPVMSARPVHVLLIDDSAVVRSLLSRALAKDGDIRVAGQAFNAIDGIEKAKALQPDIVLLDIEMPGMDGITAIPPLLKAAPGARIIVVSRLAQPNAPVTLKALKAGAAEAIAKPQIDGLEDFYRRLRDRVKGLARKSTAAATAPAEEPPPPKPQPKRTTPTAAPARKIQAVAIASSTGGPQALMTVFSCLKGFSLSVPVFVAQHMPTLFTEVLANQIETASGLRCVEGADGMMVEPGCIYIAPGNHHMTVARVRGDMCIQTNQEPPVHFCRPAADPLFASVSKAYGAHALGLVLTGMGRDGADGARAIAGAGGTAIAQSEDDCAIYGMPKAAFDTGVCRESLSLPDIAAYLRRHC